jgi:hypothetical protein
MIEKFVVSGPPRVGGNLLASIIRSCGQWTTHTHDPLLEFNNYSKIALIMVDRHDKFAALMSNCIVWKTGQDVTYSQTKVTPFVVTETEFKQQYMLNINYNQKHDLTRPYGLVESFWYEDFVNDHDHITNRLNLKILPYVPLQTIHAPYNFKELILNYLEIKELFDHLELPPN